MNYLFKKNHNITLFFLAQLGAPSSRALCRFEAMRPDQEGGEHSPKIMQSLAPLNAGRTCPTMGAHCRSYFNKSVDISHSRIIYVIQGNQNSIKTYF